MTARTNSDESHDGVWFQNSIALRGPPLVEAEELAEALLPKHLAVVVRRSSARLDEGVAEAPVVPLLMVVLEVLGEDGPEVALAERDDVVQTVFANAPDEALRVGVQIGRARRQPKDLDARAGEHAAERLRVERIPVDDEVTLLEEETVDGVGEVPRDLKHPRLAGGVSHTGEGDAPRGDLHHEEDVVADEADRGEDLGGEEVGRGDGVPVPANEGAPGRVLAPLEGAWSRGAIPSWRDAVSARR